MMNRREARPTRKPTTLRARPEDRGAIYDGTVGYNDGSPHYDLEDGGVALVKVTLFHGHNPVTEGVNHDPSRARGRRVLVRFDPTGAEIPRDGEHVIVAYAAGRGEGPGCGYIIGRPKPDPKWVPNRQSGEKIIFGPNDSFIRFKVDGSIFAFVKDGDGEDAKPVYWKLHKDGFEVRHKHGRMRTDATGFEMGHSSGATVSGGSIGGLPSPLSELSSFVNVKAALVRINSSAAFVGPDDALSDSLMKSTVTLAAFTEVLAAMVTLSTLAAAATPTGASAAAATAHTAAMALLTTGIEAVLATAATAALESA